VAQDATQAFRLLLAPASVGVGKEEVDQPAERRKPLSLPKGRLLVVEGLVVLLRRQRYSVVVGPVRLYDGCALVHSSSGPPRHLAQELEHPLSGAEVGRVKPNVGQDRAYQGDRGNMQAFRYHLCPNEDLCFPLGEPFDHGLMGTSRRGHVSVPA